MSVEGDDVSRDGSVPLTDWRIVVAAPLSIQNQLPIRGAMLVWEKPREGANLVLRQSCELGCGQTEQIYAADTRRPVFLQYHPDGYEWAEPEAILISQGFSNDQVRF